MTEERKKMTEQEKIEKIANVKPILINNWSCTAIGRNVLGKIEWNLVWGF
jgi:ABC-type molybdenum transport system ATPase subunit/photorepair protein PhrA